MNQNGRSTVSGNRTALLIFRDDIQQRASGLGGEVLLPEPGGELLDFALRMVGNSLQDVNQVGVGVDAVHSACGDETLDVLRLDKLPARVGGRRWC